MHVHNIDHVQLADFQPALILLDTQNEYSSLLINIIHANKFITYHYYYYYYYY